MDTGINMINMTNAGDKCTTFYGGMYWEILAERLPLRGLERLFYDAGFVPPAFLQCLNKRLENEGCVDTVYLDFAKVL